MAYTYRVSLFLGLLLALALLTTSLEDSARDDQESAELNKVHVVKHYFGRNHHRCRKYGVSCKPPQGADATSEEVENKQGVDASQEVKSKQGADASQKVESKQGVDAEEKAVEEDKKVHTVKHYFGRNHHRCRKYGVSCKPPQGNDASSEEVENKQGVDASQEGESKQGVDAEEKAVEEDKKVHAVKHYFGRNHHRCRKYGVSCKEDTSAQGKEDNEVAEKVGNEGVVDTNDQRGVVNGGNN